MNLLRPSTYINLIVPSDPMSLTTLISIIVLCIGLLSVILYHFFKFFEQRHSSKTNKPYFVFSHIYKRKLKPRELKILESEFDFYKNLSKKHQRIFEHRVAIFIANKGFIGRQGLEVTDQMRILISATAVMLTFGFRKYLLETLDQFLIYPGTFYSNLNESYHKGEYNPRMQVLVLSWEDFLEGYNISNDNLNLGVHEMIHAIHLNGLQEDDISSFIFKNTMLDLTEFLSENEAIRKKLVQTKYFRAYAFTNQFEFLSVLVETFIETPEEFREQFPKVYSHVKQMLNFNYAGY